MSREVKGVLFDLDGVLIDTEPIWERVRRTFAQEHGGGWSGVWGALITQRSVVQIQPGAKV